MNGTRSSAEISAEIEKLRQESRAEYETKLQAGMRQDEIQRQLDTLEQHLILQNAKEDADAAPRSDAARTVKELKIKKITQFREFGRGQYRDWTIDTLGYQLIATLIDDVGTEWDCVIAKCKTRNELQALVARYFPDGNIVEKE